MARHTRQSNEDSVSKNKAANQYKNRKRKNDENEDQHYSVNDLDGSLNDKQLHKDIEEIDRAALSPKIAKNLNSDSSSDQFDVFNNENNFNNKEKTSKKEEECKSYEKESSILGKRDNSEANMDTKAKKRSGANTCMVLSCLSPRQPGVIYHGFPKPNFPELQKQWLIACGRAINTVVLRHMRVCSNHFDEMAYERDLRNELLGLPPRRRLKIDAIPTLCLPSHKVDDNVSESPNDRSENNMNKGDDENSVLSIELQNLRQMNALKRAESAERRKEEVNRIIMKEVAKKSSNYAGVTIESERSKDGYFINHKAVLKPKHQLILTNQRNSRVIGREGKKVKASDDRITMDKLKCVQNWQSEIDKALLARLHHLEAQNEKQKDIIRQLRQENNKFKSDEYRKIIAKQELKNSGYGGPWSEAQLEYIIDYPSQSGRTKKGQIIKWSAEDMIKGIVLFQKLSLQGSKPAIRIYTELRRQYFLPLPSLPAIKNWLKQLNFQCGLQTYTLDLLSSPTFIKDSAHQSTPNEPNLAILVLDELDICKNDCISTKATFLTKTSKSKRTQNSIVESCDSFSSSDVSRENKQILVKNLVIRNLCGSKNWELPLYLDFDRKGLSKQMLMEIISEVEDRTGSAVQIWAVVLSSLKDAELIEELNLDEETCSFINPADSSRSIYCFADTRTLVAQQEKEIIVHGIEMHKENIANGPIEKYRLTKSDLEDLISSGKDSNLVASDLQSLNDAINQYQKPNHSQTTIFEDETFDSRIISHATMNALKIIFPEKIEQVKWIKIWNDFAQLMTQQNPSSENNHMLSKGFGEPFLSDKVQILDDMAKQVNGTYSIREINKTKRESNHQINKLLPFQRAILWTIKSLRSVYSHMQSYLIAFGDKDDGQELSVNTSHFNFHYYDTKFYNILQNSNKRKINSNENKFARERYHHVPKENPTFLTKRPNLYLQFLTSLRLQEDIEECKIKGRRARVGKLKRSIRKSSPPPTNPTQILEYKLSIEGKVHIPVDHPQIDRIRNKDRIEIVSKEPQIKIVYPDDPENMLLMLQQQQTQYSLSDSSILQDNVQSSKHGPAKSILQANILQEDFSSPDGTTIVIRGNIENSEQEYVKEDFINDKSIKSNSSTIDNEKNNFVRMNPVDIVDADGNINEHYYIQ